MNKSRHQTFRLSEDQWQRGKTAMRSFIEAKAAARQMTHYSELESVVRAEEGVTVPAWSPEMNWMLGEIADDCHDEGLPLLTAIVTHRSGDLEPGSGFYEKARALGYRFDASEAYLFWAGQTQECFKYWGPNRTGG